MEYRVQFVDVSSCMLFEATGDSEADSDVNKNMDHALMAEDIGLDEDDAQSCSYDNNEIEDCYSYGSTDYVYVDDDYEKEEMLLKDDKSNEDEDEDEDAVDQIRNGDYKFKVSRPRDSPGVLMEGQRRKKLKVCADSAMEFMNDRDRDRLFWETCLAS